MSNLLKKARSGRTSALISLTEKSSDTAELESSDVQFKTANRFDAVLFISTRIPSESPAWVH